MMPSATEYDPNSKTIRESARIELEQRQKMFQENYRYYMGQQKAHFKDKSDNVIINLCSQMTDDTVSFAIPDTPKVKVQDADTTDADEYLNEVWEFAGGAVLLQEIMKLGAIAGHVHCRIDPNPDGDFPRVLPIEADKIITFWDADDKSRVLWHEQYWTVGRVDYRQDFVNRGSAWDMLVYKKAGSKWELDEEQSEVWEHEFGPIVDWQHLPNKREYYGLSEYRNKGLNDFVNSTASDVKKILEIHASPKTIGIGMEASAVVPTQIENFWAVPDKDANIYNLEMQSDLVSSMNFLQFLIQSYFNENRVVMLPIDLNMFRSVTNYGVEMIFKRQSAKTDTLHRTYGNGVITISQTILAITGQDATIQMSVEWGDSLPKDRIQQIQYIQTLLGLGLISQETAAARLGLNWEDEQRKIQDEFAEQLTIQGRNQIGISG